ncbi:MAG: trans-sialidase, partial [Candidatus Nitrosotenuis sp.]
TSDWNLQKVKVTGYTQPSNKYFATRERLAYHPRQKNFAGYGIRAIAATAQASPPPTPPPPAPKPAQGTLPKDTAQTSGGSSRKEQLEAYEKSYLARLQQQEQARAAPPPTAKPNPARGSLPAGFKPQTAPTPPPAPKTNPTRGSMPQGWKPS